MECNENLEKLMAAVLLSDEKILLWKYRCLVLPIGASIVESALVLQPQIRHRRENLCFVPGYHASQLSCRKPHS